MKKKGKWELEMSLTPQIRGKFPHSPHLPIPSITLLAWYRICQSSSMLMTYLSMLHFCFQACWWRTMWNSVRTKILDMFERHYCHKADFPFLYCEFSWNSKSVNPVTPVAKAKTVRNGRVKICYYNLRANTRVGLSERRRVRRKLYRSLRFVSADFMHLPAESGGWHKGVTSIRDPLAAICHFKPRAGPIASS